MARRGELKAKPAPRANMRSARESKIRAAAPIIIVLVAMGAALPTVWFPFVDWDDGPNVLQNPWLNPPTLQGLIASWKAPYYGIYAPVTRTVWFLLARASGTTPDPHIFHTANVIVHVLNVLLVYTLLLRLVQHVGAASLGALLFALHPLQAEPVSWVTGMKDLLGAFLSLCAILAYVRYAQSHAHDGKRYLWYTTASAAYLLALLAKPAGVCVPLMAWILDVGMIRRSVRQATLALVPWLLPIAPIAWVTAAAEKANSLVPYTRWSVRPLVAADALGFYLVKLVWPASLCMDYGRTPHVVLQSPWRFAALSAPALLAGAAWLLRRRAVALTVAIGLFAGALLPVLGLVPFAYQSYSTTADRYVYLAMLAPALAGAWFVATYRRAWIVAIACGTLLLSAILFAAQEQTWRSSQALFEHALRINPRSSIANNNVGVMELTEGRYDAALKHFRQALQTAPQYPEAHYNLGLLYARIGRTAAAQEEFRAVIRWKPDYAMAYNDLGVLLLQQGRLDEARSCFQKALQLQPNAGLFQNNLSIVLQRLAVKRTRARAPSTPGHP